MKLQDESQALEMRKNVREQINVKRKFKTVSQSMKKFYKDRATSKLQRGTARAAAPARPGITRDRLIITGPSAARAFSASSRVA